MKIFAWNMAGDLGSAIVGKDFGLRYKGAEKYTVPPESAAKMTMKLRSALAQCS